MVAIKRPGIGIEPKYLNEIIGKKAKKSISKDEVLK
jgi:N-acetylneuraminate synthase/N,N'-diacetyllegionaminate synthase